MRVTGKMGIGMLLMMMRWVATARMRVSGEPNDNRRRLQAASVGNASGEEATCRGIVAVMLEGRHRIIGVPDVRHSFFRIRQDSVGRLKG